MGSGYSYLLLRTGNEQKPRTSASTLHELLPFRRIIIRAYIVWSAPLLIACVAASFVTCHGGAPGFAMLLNAPVAAWQIYDERILMQELKQKVLVGPSKTVLVRLYVSAREFPDYLKLPQKGLMASIPILQIFSVLDSYDIATDTLFPIIARACDHMVGPSIADSFSTLPLVGKSFSWLLTKVQFWTIALAALVIFVYLLQAVRGMIRLHSIAARLAATSASSPASVQEGVGIKPQAGDTEEKAALWARGVLKGVQSMAGSSSAVQAGEIVEAAEFASLLAVSKVLADLADFDFEESQKDKERYTDVGRQHIRAAINAYILKGLAFKVLGENVLQMELQSTFVAGKAASVAIGLQSTIISGTSMLLGAVSALSKCKEYYQKAVDNFTRRVVAGFSVVVSLLVMHVALKVVAVFYCESHMLNIFEGGCHVVANSAPDV